jgi:hypothetical protein
MEKHVTGFCAKKTTKNKAIFSSMFAGETYHTFLCQKDSEK